MGNEGSKAKKKKRHSGSSSAKESPEIAGQSPTLLMFSEDSSKPAILLKDAFLRSISASTSHLIVISEKLEPWAYGTGDDGRLGVKQEEIKETANRFIPLYVGVASAQPVKMVVASPTATHFLSDKGKVYVCGTSANGMLGLGFTITSKQIRQIETLDNITWISGGFEHMLAVDNQGHIFGWGKASEGRLGLGSTRTGIESKPVEITSHYLKKKRVVKTACGGAHSLFLTSAGEIFSCGRGNEGQLGYGGKQTHDSLRSITYTLLEEDDQVVMVYASEKASHALTLNGRVFGWGGGSTMPDVLSFESASETSADPSSPTNARILHIFSGERGRNGGLSDEGVIYIWEDEELQEEPPQAKVLPLFKSGFRSDDEGSPLVVNYASFFKHNLVVSLGGPMPAYTSFEKVQESAGESEIRNKLFAGKDKEDLTKRAVERARRNIKDNEGEDEYTISERQRSERRERELEEADRLRKELFQTPQKKAGPQHSGGSKQANHRKWGTAATPGSKKSIEEDEDFPAGRKQHLESSGSEDNEEEDVDDIAAEIFGKAITAGGKKEKESSKPQQTLSSDNNNRTTSTSGEIGKRRQQLNKSDNTPPAKQDAEEDDDDVNRMRNELFKKPEKKTVVPANSNNKKETSDENESGSDSEKESKNEVFMKPPTGKSKEKEKEVSPRSNETAAYSGLFAVVSKASPATTDAHAKKKGPSIEEKDEWKDDHEVKDDDLDSMLNQMDKTFAKTFGSGGMKKPLSPGAPKTSSYNTSIKKKGEASEYLEQFKQESTPQPKPKILAVETVQAPKAAEQTKPPERPSVPPTETPSTISKSHEIPQDTHHKDSDEENDSFSSSEDEDSASLLAPPKVESPQDFDDDSLL